MNFLCALWFLYVRLMLSLLDASHSLFSNASSVCFHVFTLVFHIGLLVRAPYYLLFLGAVLAVLVGMILPWRPRRGRDISQVAEGRLSSLQTLGRWHYA